MKKANAIEYASYPVGAFLSKLFGGIVKLRQFAYNTRLLKTETLPCYTISIGNITVGGTGKTPLTLYMARLLTGWGFKVVILSRGYKGEAERSGGMVTDGHHIFMDAAQAGDEPYLMACDLHDVPIFVGKNRIENGRKAIHKFHPHIILLDDGFQHIKLHRHLNIVLLDAESPFGNSHLLPRGKLREPISNLSRGDLFVFTRADRVNDVEKTSIQEALATIVPERPMFLAAHVPYIKRVVYPGTHCSTPGIAHAVHNDFSLKSKPVVAFSGIAKNHAFKDTLIRLGAVPVKTFSFKDHQKYTPAHLNDIKKASENQQAELIVTTEKDFVKLADRHRFPLPLAVIDISISFGAQQNRFHDLIRSQVKSADTNDRFTRSIDGE